MIRPLITRRDLARLAVDFLAAAVVVFVVLVVPALVFSLGVAIGG